MVIGIYINTLIGVEPRILDFAVFCLKAITMQSRLRDGIPLSEATTDRVLKELVRGKRLRNLIRGLTPEHLYVLLSHVITVSVNCTPL